MLLEQPVFALELDQFQVLHHGLFQGKGFPGLGDVAVDLSLVDRVHQVVDLGVAGQNNPYRLGRQKERFPQNVHARRFGHSLVRDDDVDGPIPQELNGIGTIHRFENPKVSEEGAPQLLEIGDLVVDDKQAVFVFHRLERPGHCQKGDYNVSPSACQPVSLSVC